MPDPEGKETEKALKWRPEDVSIPPEVEKKEGVVPRPSQFTGQVYDDSGKPLIQTPQTKTVTVSLPMDDKALTSASKGSITDSITWLAAFWLRIIKKALHFGWGVVRKKEV